MNFSEKYIAHIRDEDNERQPLIDHLTQTAILAALFAGKFYNSELGYYAGLLHDIGKYSDEFQRKIKNRLNIKCDHSAAGARELEKLGKLGKMLSYCVAGHHAGLPDSGSRFSSAGDGTLYGRLNKEYIVNNYDAYLQEIKNEISLCEPNIKPMGKKGFSISFFVRMLYSCLVDADFLDTEKFMQNGRIARAEDFDFNEILSKLNKKLSEFSGSSGIINEKRAEILNSCRQKGSEEQPGLFTLTVPTGGGKTLSSMAFALNHLMRNGMKRIIYVIPYTSIIEQTAKIFKDVFGEDCVLEHHSNYSFPEDENDDKKNIMKLSSENWSMPIIVTTNVQFFESLFANKPSKCRKLHNIANSVIIFDEVQMLPVIYLKPCVRAIAELVHNYKCTAVLCTATQPSINSLFPKDIKMPK
ncbi:MAG TPA: CRISPR-associated endonuclease Cas3'', partial [Oscillospiraceae bacterium]|nr:CRISPR-associated endonuclease Cas3'' [Oscillospiraceae bacterium]